MTERAQFEAWAADKPVHLATNKNGSYVHASAHMVWLAWQARAELAAAEVAQIDKIACTLQDTCHAQAQIISMQTQWRDIATVPKDGMPVLVWLEEETLGSKTHVAVFTSNISTIGGNFAFDMPKPSHWQPLPPPPKE